MDAHSDALEARHFLSGIGGSTEAAQMREAIRQRNNGLGCSCCKLWPKLLKAELVEADEPESKRARVGKTGMGRRLVHPTLNGR
jgi:hypothetical protein